MSQVKTKVCSTCRKKRAAKFFSRRVASRDGLHLVCKSCDNARLKRWRKKNPGYSAKWFARHPGYKEARLKRDPLMNRRGHLRYAYGMTLDDFDRLLARQRKKCAICRRTSFKPVVDHNHKTGKVRGILCPRCNCAIGFLSESPPIFKRALKYIQRYSK